MVVGFSGKTVTPEVKKLIHSYHVGGIILFSRNIGTPEDVYNLTTSLQDEAKQAGYERPLFICLDQENGVVRRLGQGTTLFPGAMALGATNQPELARDVYRATGDELRALGINWNLAPVLDINNNPDSPVIGVRSFGETADMVTDFGRAAMQGMQEAGVVTALKHFPGHGDTHVDSHLSLPTIAHDMDRLEAVELKPFQLCIEAGADVVMAAHVHFPAIEPEKDKPATLSKQVLTHLLREKLGFDGVVTTDCMEMDAIGRTIGTEQGAVEAFKAGSDLIMVSHTMEKQIGAIHALATAVEKGEIEEAVIQQSIRRINQLLDRYVSWESLSERNQNTELSKVCSDEHQKLAQSVYEKSVTVVQNDHSLPLTSDEKILVIQSGNQLQTRAEDVHQHQGLIDAVKQYVPTAEVEEMIATMPDDVFHRLLSKASTYETVILGTLGVAPGDRASELIKTLETKDVKVIGIGMRNPYDAYNLVGVNGFLNTYEPSFPALQTAVAAIFGKQDVSGKLPVTLR